MSAKSVRKSAATASTKVTDVNCPSGIEGLDDILAGGLPSQGFYLIQGDPGSGKTMGIRDLVKTAGSKAVLAIVTPKNNEDEQALGDQLYTALGLPLRGHWRTRKPKLMGHLHQ